MSKIVFKYHYLIFQNKINNPILQFKIIYDLYILSLFCYLILHFKIIIIRYYYFLKKLLKDYQKNKILHQHLKFHFLIS